MIIMKVVEGDVSAETQWIWVRKLIGLLGIVISG